MAALCRSERRLRRSLDERRCDRYDSQRDRIADSIGRRHSRSRRQSMRGLRPESRASSLGTAALARSATRERCGARASRHASPSASMPRTAKSRCRAGPRRRRSKLSTWRSASKMPASPRSFSPTSRATVCLAGVNVDATAALANAVRIPIIASGGVSGMDDIEALMAAPSPQYLGGRDRPRAV